MYGRLYNLAVFCPKLTRNKEENAADAILYYYPTNEKCTGNNRHNTKSNAQLNFVGFCTAAICLAERFGQRSNQRFIIESYNTYNNNNNNINSNKNNINNTICMSSITKDIWLAVEVELSSELLKNKPYEISNNSQKATEKENTEIDNVKKSKSNINNSFIDCSREDRTEQVKSAAGCWCLLIERVSSLFLLNTSRECVSLFERETCICNTKEEHFVRTTREQAICVDDNATDKHHEPHVSHLGNLRESVEMFFDRFVKYLLNILCVETVKLPIKSNVTERLIDSNKNIVTSDSVISNNSNINEHLNGIHNTCEERESQQEQQPEKSVHHISCAHNNINNNNNNNNNINNDSVSEYIREMAVHDAQTGGKCEPSFYYMAIVSKVTEMITHRLEFFLSTFYGSREPCLSHSYHYIVFDLPSLQLITTSLETSIVAGAKLNWFMNINMPYDTYMYIHRSNQKNVSVIDKDCNSNNSNNENGDAREQGEMVECSEEYDSYRVIYPQVNNLEENSKVAIAVLLSSKWININNAVVATLENFLLPWWTQEIEQFIITCTNNKWGFGKPVPVSNVEIQSYLNKQHEALLSYHTPITEYNLSKHTETRIAVKAHANVDIPAFYRPVNNYANDVFQWVALGYNIRKGASVWQSAFPTHIQARFYSLLYRAMLFTHTHYNEQEQEEQLAWNKMRTSLQLGNSNRGQSYISNVDSNSNANDEKHNNINNTNVNTHTTSNNTTTDMLNTLSLPFIWIWHHEHWLVIVVRNHWVIGIVIKDTVPLQNALPYVERLVYRITSSESQVVK